MDKKTTKIPKKDIELLKQFNEQNLDIKKAIANMLAEADKIASGEKKSATSDEIFGEDD
jgi:hypothetical protein